MTIAGILQMGGVGSVVPFLTILDNHRLIHRNWLLEGLYSGLGFSTETAFVLFAGLIVLTIVVASTVATAITEWLTVQFARDRQHRLSVKLLELYLSRPFLDITHQNAANLSKNVLTEAAVFANGIVGAQARLLAHSLRVAAILGILIWLNPALTTLAFLTMGGTYVILYKLARKGTHTSGERRSRAIVERLRIASEAFGGLKELQVLGRQGYYVDSFVEPSQDYAKAEASVQVTSLIPRYAVELVAFAGMVVIVLYLMHTRHDLGLVLPLASAYAFAAYRIRPSLQTMFESLTSLRFNAPALEVLRRDLSPHFAQPERRVTDKRLNFCDSLRFEAISFTYPGRTNTGILDVSFVVPKGTAVALVGPTGAGKTTLVDVVAGLLVPSAGKLVVDGTPICGANLRQWQNLIGYVPQNIFLSDASIAANIALGLPPELRDQSAIERAARIANLHNFIMRELPDGYQTIVGERGVRLSGGQRQRIGLARALYNDPEVLLLDEATSALDGETEDTVHRSIESVMQAKTVIIVAHRLSTVRSCKKIYLMEEGRVAASGTYEELLATNPRFRAMAQTLT